MIRRAGFAVFAVALALPVAAEAFTQYGQQTMSRWSASDRCAAAAQKNFPDFTAEANAKRDAWLKNCLSSQILPPRGSLDKAPP
jgi:hypothetical protein